MGKASRERARRRVALGTTVLAEAPSARSVSGGAAFGLGLDGRPAGLPRPITPSPARTQNQPAHAAYEPSPELLRRIQHADPLREGLTRLKDLAARRAEARTVVVRHDEQIRSAVAHLRVDGASWSQIGTALGISRQGARQRFSARPDGDKRVPLRSTTSGSHRTRSDVPGGQLPAQSDQEEEQEWTSSRL
ncbi:hypothetical protein [Cellulomonas sp. T2.31MG-18]|uniref:hypothetical protein n=1 Tax=Cellulomonas sp. T2.31MG-18 TaxID=3157619 RepID=UPI00366EF90E